MNSFGFMLMLRFAATFPVPAPLPSCTHTLIYTGLLCGPKPPRELLAPRILCSIILSYCASRLLFGSLHPAAFLFVCISSHRFRTPWWSGRKTCWALLPCTGRTFSGILRCFFLWKRPLPLLLAPPLNGLILLLSCEKGRLADDLALVRRKFRAELLAVVSWKFDWL